MVSQSGRIFIKSHTRIGCIVIACLLCASAAIGAENAPGDYDSKPFLRGLSRAYRKNTVARVGVSSLSDLPLYQIDMELNTVLGTIDIHEQINYKNTTGRSLPELVFRTYPNVAWLTEGKARNLEISAVTINGAPVEFEWINPTAMRISLAVPLPANSRVLVGIDCKAVVPRMHADAGVQIGNVLAELMGKQGREGYGTYGHSLGIFNLGYFYPILPARLQSGWDAEEPPGMGDLANFEVANYLVKLRLPKAALVASSGIQVGEQPLGPGAAAKKDVFLMGTAVRDFALQVSTRYIVREKKSGGLRLRAFVLQEKESEAEELLARAVSAVKIYSRMFGPYPYAELDVAYAPLVGGAGGMEYPGLVTIAIAVAGPRVAGPMGDMMAGLMKKTGIEEFVLAHEIAHQWFHALVGSDSIRHPFLDESPANYAAVLYFEKKHGSQAATRQLQMELALPYQLHRAFGGNDGAVDRQVKDFDNQLQYAGLVYGKGALFLHFLRRTLGQKTFLRCMRAYTRKLSFKRATPGDLQAAFVRGSGKPARVKKMFRHWLQDSHADEDLSKLKLMDLNNLLAMLKNMKGFHNIKFDGSLDPAVMKMFQQAVRQFSGGP
ncbi:MAG TPA: M1 family metallopeptidase [Myxococcota bacterium]|nr:M1 family metallopeptidase [Myxococcota bacterium]